MGRSYSTHGRMGNVYKEFDRKLERMRPLGIPVHVDFKDIILWV
jgi:hypothetical protein